MWVGLAVGWVVLLLLFCGFLALRGRGVQINMQTGEKVRTRGRWDWDLPHTWRDEDRA